MYHLTPQRTSKMLEENELLLPTNRVDSANFLKQSIFNTLSRTSHIHTIHKYVIIVFLELKH
jgi:hypothetical protein